MIPIDVKEIENLSRGDGIIFMIMLGIMIITKIWQAVYIKWKLIGGKQIALYVTCGFVATVLGGLFIGLKCLKVNEAAEYDNLIFIYVFIVAYSSSECLIELITRFDFKVIDRLGNADYFDKLKAKTVQTWVYVWGYQGLGLINNMIIYSGTLQEYKYFFLTYLMIVGVIMLYHVYDCPSEDEGQLGEEERIMSGLFLAHSLLTALYISNMNAEKTEIYRFFQVIVFHVVLHTYYTGVYHYSFF